MKKRKIKYAEISILAFVWFVLLLTPILFREDTNNPVWNSINNQLEILVPLSLLFLVNRFVLVPNLYMVSLTLACPRMQPWPTGGETSCGSWLR